MEAFYFLDSLEVQNKGKRDAQNCEALVTFKKLDSLTLYPAEKGDVLVNSKKFNILAGEKKQLVAAWEFSGTGIDGNAGFGKGIFLERAPPIEVVISYGEKKVRKSLDEKEIEKTMRKIDEDEYING